MNIHEKIEQLVAQSGHSLRHAAISSDLSYNALHSSIVNRRKIGFEDVAALAKHFSVSIQHFAPDHLVQQDTDHHANPKPDATTESLLTDALKTLEAAKRRVSKQVYDISLDGFLDWWYANSGRLENFDAIASRVDMFHPPASDAQIINPASVGGSSLAAICFEIQHQDDLRKTLDGFSPLLNNDLVRAHHQAHLRGEPVITHPSLNETLLNGKSFQKQYRRVLAPILKKDGTTMIVNFSQFMSTPSP